MDMETLVAKDAIRDAIYRYCRVLDRMDKQGAYDLWNENSTALYHGIFEGSGPGFVDWVWEAHAALERHSHQITNVLIEVSGESAVSESYVTVTLWPPADAEGTVQEIVARGRYLDKWSVQSGRDGRKRWGIDSREHIVDMHSVVTVTPGDVAAESRRDSQDPSFKLFS